MSTAGKEIADDEVVATVAGTPILYQTVKVDFDEAIRLFKAKEGKEPTTNEDFEKVLKRDMMGTINRRFLGAIKEIIREKIVQRHNITVTKQEAKQEWLRQMGGVSEQERDQTANRAMKVYALLIPALKEVYEQGMDKDAAYQKYFKEHETEMPQSEWRSALNQFNTPRKIKALEMMQDAVKNKERQVASFRRVVENRKLNAVIDRELGKTDPEVAAFIKRQKKDIARDPFAADLAPFAIQLKRRHWWREQHRKADVQIRTSGDLIGKDTWLNYLDSPVR